MMKCLGWSHFRVIQVSAYCLIVVCSPFWGSSHSLRFNLASWNQARGLFTHILLSHFAGEANSMVKKSRLELLPGHSGKCILLNCGFFPRLGAHPPLSSFQPGQLEQSEGVIYSHIVCLILQARHFNGEMSQ